MVRRGRRQFGFPGSLWLVKCNLWFKKGAYLFKVTHWCLEKCRRSLYRCKENVAATIFEKIWLISYHQKYTGSSKVNTTSVARAENFSKWKYALEVRRKRHQCRFPGSSWLVKRNQWFKKGAYLFKVTHWCLEKCRRNLYRCKENVAATIFESNMVDFLSSKIHRVVLSNNHRCCESGECSQMEIRTSGEKRTTPIRFSREFVVS